MKSNPAQNAADDGVTKNRLYLTIWRWHFYSGLYVVPYMVILAVTGLLMLYGPLVDEWTYARQLSVKPMGQPASYIDQLNAVMSSYSDAMVTRFRPNVDANRSSVVSLTTSDGKEIDVYVNPYTREVLGTIDHENRLETIAMNIHGTLLIGDLGDRLLEIAAGLGVLLLVSGVFLWWPRNARGVWGVLIPRLQQRGRTLWRDLHAVPAIYGAVALLFFLISGMSWTGIWGDRYVQAWNTFPDGMWANVPKSDKTMESLNRPGEKVVPWNLENSRMPASGSMAGEPGIPQGMPVNLDTIVRFVRDNGVDYGFWVAFPQDDDGVWTVSASSMSGDVTDARKDLTLHIDRYTGRLLAVIGWDQYGLGAKAMAWGVAMHQGDLGIWNMVLNTLFCLLVILLCISAVVMWLRRRPSGANRLVAPPMPTGVSWKPIAAMLLVLSVLFPLAGIVLVGVILLDAVVISRISRIKQWLA
jgi:uncharacterized iron-regulated membrane protein